MESVRGRQRNLLESMWEGHCIRRLYFCAGADSIRYGE
jgi:hypothetical protein